MAPVSRIGLPSVLRTCARFERSGTMPRQGLAIAEPAIPSTREMHITNRNRSLAPIINYKHAGPAIAGFIRTMHLYALIVSPKPIREHLLICFDARRANSGCQF